MLSLGRDEVQCVTEWLGISSQIMLYFTCTHFKDCLNRIGSKVKDLCDYAAEDNNSRVLCWARERRYKWGLSTYTNAVRVNAVCTIWYIEACDPEFYSSKCLDNMKTIRRALMGLIDLKSIFEVMLNTELVLARKKLCYVCQFDPCVAVAMSTYFPVASAQMIDGYLIFLKERVHELANIVTVDTPNHRKVALVGEYEYKGRRTGNCYNVRFVTQHGDLLYSYRCPVGRYNDDILKGEQIRAESFNEVLSPLGFTVSVEVV